MLEPQGCAFNRHGLTNMFIVTAHLKLNFPEFHVMKLFHSCTSHHKQEWSQANKDLVIPINTWTFTGIEKTFGEDFLLFLVLNTSQLWKIAEHFVAHDHHTTSVLPVVQQLTAAPVILNAAELINLHHRKWDSVQSQSSEHTFQNIIQQHSWNSTHFSINNNHNNNCWKQRLKFSSNNCNNK